MGAFADSVRALARVLPPSPAQHAIAATVQTWDNGREVMPPYSYWRNAREGYMVDEIVYACIEFRATSAGEPPVVAFRPGSDEKLTQHPALTLLNHPNPFMGRSRFWASVMMMQDIGGNCYIEKVRSAAGKVVQLWPLRPDRITVIPSATEFIGGYRYLIGDQSFTLANEDVIHFKARHPLDDYYGLPPIAVGAERIDLDVWVRKFTRAFFQNAGVPSGLLNIVGTLNESDRLAITRNFVGEFSGPTGWFKPLVLGPSQATYTPMGLPLGDNGLALSGVNEFNETRICALYSVPVSLIPTIAGANSKIAANQDVDHKQFWQNTMIPIFRDQDSTLTAGLIDEYPDLERFEHDLGSIAALQEDQDKLHVRWRDTYKSGLATYQEARQKIGLPAEPDESGMLLVPTLMSPTWSDDMLTEPEPEPATVVPPADGSGQAPLPPGQPRPLPQPANGRTNGAQH